MKLVSNFGVFSLDGVRIFPQAISISFSQPSTVNGVFHDGLIKNPISGYDICYVIRNADIDPFVEFVKEK